MDLPQRKQIRLKDFDYSSGRAYFVTICTANKRNMLSTICRGDPCGRPQVVLSEMGNIAKETFQRIEELYGVIFDYRVIMPNHIHFVVVLPQEQRATARVAPTLGQVVGAYKSIIARNWCAVCDSKNRTAGKVWQRNYDEHVVRNDQDLFEIRKYIDENPDKWAEDKLYNPEK